MLMRLLKRDVRTAWTGNGSAVHGLVFFGMCYSLMVMSYRPELLADIKQSLLAISLLLTILLTLPSMLDEDMRDGSLEQYLMLPVSRSWLMLAKMLAYWLSHVLPLLLLIAAIQWAEGGEVDLSRLIFMSLWLTAVGGIGAILGLLHGKGMIARALVMIPLYLPALIAATLPDSTSGLALLLAAGALLLWPVAALFGAYLLGLVVE